MRRTATLPWTAGIVLAVLFAGAAAAQVTPAESAPTKDPKALRGVTSYWVEDVKDTERSVLQQLASTLEKKVPGLKPAASRQSAGMILELRAVEELGLTTHGTFRSKFHGSVFCGETLVWLWEGKSGFFSGDTQLGQAFGEWVAGKWKKANPK